MRNWLTPWTHSSIGSLGLALFITSLLLVPVGLYAQSMGLGKYPLQTRGTRSVQNSVKVDNSVTPNKTEIGCEANQIDGTTVNGVTLVGAATGVGPTIQSIGCPAIGDTNVPLNLVGQGTGPVNLGSATSPVAVATVYTTFFAWIDVNSCDADSTNLIKTRAASGDWALSRTAGGAETYNIHCAFAPPMRTTASKGTRIDAWSVAYKVGVVNLTSATWQNWNLTTYANAVANSVATYGGANTISLPTVVQATPYLTPGTFAAAAFLNTASTNISVDFQVVMANTGTFAFYGIYVTYSEALL